MKVTLVCFEALATGRQAGFGYASYSLAVKLLESELLDRVICRTAETADAFPADRIRIMDRDPWYRLQWRFIGRLGAFFPWLNHRRWREQLFDRYVQRHLCAERGAIFFSTRPLMVDSMEKAKEAGMQAWTLTSVPHPLSNYALGRNEELRNGLDRDGPITDIQRTDRLARVMVLADRIVTMHPEIGRYVHESFLPFVEPHRLLCLKDYFPVDPSEYAALTGPRGPQPGKNGVDFLHVSHIIFLKGITYLLDAWRIFKARDTTGSRLLLVGVIDRRVQKVIDECYADLKDVEYRGWVPDLMPHFKAADVFVSPSVTDAGPVTIIEAMAAGLPVISSNNCGFASLLTDGQDGFRYEYNDVEALARIFRRVADEPADLPRLSANAFANAQGRSIDAYTEELVKLFREHLA